jgi:cell division protein FtsB
MFRFTIRDVLWLTVVVALAVGWWIDQDRIRRQRAALQASEQALVDEREKLRTEVQLLQALPLRQAQARFDVTEAEVASMIEIKRRNPRAISDSQLRVEELRLEVARLDLEKARKREEIGAATNSPPQGQSPTGLTRGSPQNANRP